MRVSPVRTTSTNLSPRHLHRPSTGEPKTDTIGNFEVPSKTDLFLKTTIFVDLWCPILLTVTLRRLHRILSLRTEVKTTTKMYIE